MADKSKYDVGFGKPPVVHRFRKGQSGNPNGRPKGAKSLSGLLTEELNAKITVQENGKRKAITKQKALAKQVVNKALEANPAVIKLLLACLDPAVQAPLAPAQPTAPLTEDEQAIVTSALERLQRTRQQQAGAADPPSSEGANDDQN